MDKFSEALLKFSGSLISQYETVFEHHGNRGDSRESAVAEYLAKVMPSGVGFAKGEMFDRNGMNSGEVDLIMYDKVFSTVLSDGSGKILAPVESCFGAIECKSALTIAELDNCLSKIAKYRSMARVTGPSKTIHILPTVAIEPTQGLTFSASYNVPLFGVFCYENKIAVPTLLERLRHDTGLDYIVVPGKLIYLRRMKAAPPALGNDGFILETDRSIAIWVMYLQTMLKGIRLVGIDTFRLLRQLVEDLPIVRKRWPHETNNE